MHQPVLEGRGRRPPDLPPVPAYSSRMLDRYLAFLQKSPKPAILDLGPTCGANISFFAERGGLLCVCDFMLRFAGDESKGHGPGTVGGILDYRPGSFDGIHLWDIPDHLDNRALLEIAQRCRTLLKKHGRVMALASASPDPEPFENYLVVNSNLSVTLRESQAHRYPYLYRSNRDIEAAMKPLEQCASFVCMNGWREFLFR